MNLQSELGAVNVLAVKSAAYVVATDQATVRSVVERMRDEAANVAVVTQDGKLVGLLADADVGERVLGHPDRWDKPIADLMTPSPATIGSDANLAQALPMLQKGGVVPVIDGQGAVRGLLTRATVLRYISEHYNTFVYNIPPEAERALREGVHR